MKVHYTDTASADLEDILDYLIERNPRAAIAVGQAIETTVSRVAMFPDPPKQPTNRPYAWRPPGDFLI